VILADRDFRRVAQLKTSVVRAHEAGLGIGLGEPALATLAHTLQLFPHPLDLFLADARARRAIRIVVHMLLPFRHLAFQLRRPQHPLAGRIRSHARRIDGHRSYPRQPRTPQQAEHLCEQLPDGPRMPAMKLAQGLVIGRGPARQKTKAQVFPHSLLSLRVVRTFSANAYSHTFTISRGSYGLCPPASE